MKQGRSSFFVLRSSFAGERIVPPPSTFHPPSRTKNEERRTTNAARGFTLVEVTLAAVVISMGLLALFGLGQIALRNAKNAEDDTRSAMLAEDVFASLRTVSEGLCTTGGPSAWTSFWSDFAAGSKSLPILLPTATSFSNRFDNTVWGDGRSCTNELYSRPDVHGSGLAVPEWSARYSLDLALDATNLVRVTLHIVPGFSGSPGESRSFYTHFTEHGTLP